MELANKSYNLSMNELLVLLAAKNARQLYGVFDMDFAMPDEAEVNITLFNMGKRGIISFDNGIEIREEIGELIEVIRDAEMLLIASSSDEATRDMAFYIGKRIVFLRFTGIERERVRIEEIGAADIARRLYESEWMIANNTSDIIEGDGHLENSDVCADLFDTGKNELCETSGIKSALLLMNISNNEKLAHLLLVQETLNDYLVMDDGTDRDVYQFTDRQFDVLITELINKGKEKIKG